MDKLITKLQEKAKACGDKTKEDRARKGAYIDCIVELKALRQPHVSGVLIGKKIKYKGVEQTIIDTNESDFQPCLKRRMINAENYG